MAIFFAWSSFTLAESGAWIRHLSEASQSCACAESCVHFQYEDFGLCLVQDSGCSLSLDAPHDSDTVMCSSLIPMSQLIVVTSFGSIDYASEISWTVSCDDMTELSGGAPFTGSLTAASSATCELLMSDSYGDGWSDFGWYAVGLGLRFTLSDGYTGNETFRVINSPARPPQPSSPPPSPPFAPPQPPRPPLPPFAPSLDMSVGMRCNDGDCYEDEISWMLNCSGGGSLAGSSPFSGRLTVPGGAICTLTLRDSYGDGWHGATWSTNVGFETTLAACALPSSSSPSPTAPTTPICGYGGVETFMVYGRCPQQCNSMHRGWAARCGLPQCEDCPQCHLSPPPVMPSPPAMPPPFPTLPLPGLPPQNHPMPTVSLPSPSLPPHPPSSPFAIDTFDTVRQWWSTPPEASAWNWHFGPTPSIGTGPSAGVGGFGAYAYAEMSGGAPTATMVFNGSQLCGPPFPVIGQVSWRYHMRGAGVGTLALVREPAVSEAAIWSKIGGQGDAWLHASASVGGSSFAFRATHGSGSSAWASDIAIDSVRVACAQALVLSPALPPLLPNAPPLGPPSNPPHSPSSPRCPPPSPGEPPQVPPPAMPPKPPLTTPGPPLSPPSLPSPLLPSLQSLDPSPPLPLPPPLYPVRIMSTAADLFGAIQNVTSSATFFLPPGTYYEMPSETLVMCALGAL